MEHFNQALFLLLNAPVLPSLPLVGLAIFFAQYFIWVVPITWAIGWLRGSEACRHATLLAAAASLVALCANLLIGTVWPQPRPFMIGLGHTLIPHVADASFPSDHLTLLWSTALALSLRAPTRRIGLMLVGSGLPMAWSRIYLGVHFPLDMLGAFAVASAAAWLCSCMEHRVLDRAYVPLLLLYRQLCAPLIRRGLLRL
jgi:undecaprenyl-diphosphatase